MVGKSGKAGKAGTKKKGEKKDKKEKKQIILSEGSSYRILSIGSRDNPLDSKGLFMGYTNIASDEGICIELDYSNGELSGIVRVVPTNVIMCIDILKAAEDDKPKETKYSASHYYS